MAGRLDVGLGPTLPATGPAATSTLGSEVGAKHSLPPPLPPMGRFRDPSAVLALPYQPPKGQPCTEACSLDCLPPEPVREPSAFPYRALYASIKG